MIFNFARKPALLSAIGQTAESGSLFDLEEGSTAILSDFELPELVADQLMNLGFVPGLEVKVTRSGPGGDPRIYRIDGVEIALRRDLAERMRVTQRPCENTDRMASPAETRRYAGQDGMSTLSPKIEEAGD